MPAAPRLRRRGQAWFEHPWLARVLQPRYPGERPACGQRAGDGAGSQLSGVVVQIRGGSVIFGALTGELACSAVLAHVLVGRRGTRAARARGGPLHNKLALLLALAERKIFEKARLPVGTAGFEPATP